MKDEFARALRAPVRALWSGVYAPNEFIEAFDQALIHYLPKAWQEGLDRFDLTLDDISDKEKRALSTFIANQLQYVPRLADRILLESKANGGNLNPLFAELALWVNRYNEAKSQAMMMAGADAKLIWKYGKTQEHCPTCASLVGKVKRASTWEQLRTDTGIYPQSKKLACHGYRCECSLNPTRQPITPGRLPIVYE